MIVTFKFTMLYNNIYRKKKEKKKKFGCDFTREMPCFVPQKIPANVRNSWNNFPAFSTTYEINCEVARLNIT